SLFGIRLVRTSVFFHHFEQWNHNRRIGKTKDLVLDLGNTGRRSQLAFQRIRIDDPNVGRATLDYVAGFLPNVDHPVVRRKDLNPQEWHRGWETLLRRW